MVYCRNRRCGLLYVVGARITGRMDAVTVGRMALWSRIGLSVTLLYSGLVKVTNPWYVLGRSIVDFKVGFTSDSPLVQPLSVAIPCVAAAWRQMQVARGCWGGTMLIGPLWFCEHGGMFLMALAADEVTASES